MNEASAPKLRVATYNVHGCVGMDRQRSEARIAEVIAQLSVDIVALQELDLSRRRSEPRAVREHVLAERVLQPKPGPEQDAIAHRGKADESRDGRSGNQGQQGQRLEAGGGNGALDDVQCSERHSQLQQAGKAAQHAPMGVVPGPPPETVVFVTAAEAARHGIETANAHAGQVFFDQFGEECTVV